MLLILNEKTSCLKIHTRIYGSTNSWRLIDNGSDGQFKDCIVNLEIQGNDKQGYCLVISPEGFFTADHHYDCLKDVIHLYTVIDAEEMFGVKFILPSPPPTPQVGKP